MLRRWMTALLVGLLLFSAAYAKEAENIIDRCAFQVSEGSASEITDVSMTSAWKPKGADPEVMMRLPDSGATYFQINWVAPAVNFEITQYDAAQNILSTVTQSETDYGFYANVYPVDAGAKYVRIRFQQSGQGINKIRVYGEGDLPRTAVRWQPSHSDCDLMVISTHMDDEWLWFGGIIPYYDTVLGYKVQVVYMANCGRMRYAEAMNALASAGVRTHPEFIGLVDERIDSLSKTLEHWGGQEKMTQIMVELIRRYKPEVILTHDWNGEYGHNQHILTSRCMETVIEAAADESRYSDLGEAWQVQKLYRHLETKCPIEFDWHQSFPELDGRTLLQTAKDAMEENASQTRYYQVKDHGNYDNAKFGLSYSTVGEDTLHEDLFENVNFSAAEPTAAPTPEATEAPEIDAAAQAQSDESDRIDSTDSEAMTDSEAIAPEIDAPVDSEIERTDAPASEGKRFGAGTIIALALAALLVLAAVALVIAFVRQNAASTRKKKRRGKKRR